MTDSMLPIIRQMHDADDHRDRAAILLRVPDMVLIKYREVFETACRRAGFELGLHFIDCRRATWHAPRLADGTLPPGPYDELRAALADFVAERPA